MKTFRLMWRDFLYAWNEAAPVAKLLLLILAAMVFGWTTYACIVVL